MTAATLDQAQIKAEGERLLSARSTAIERYIRAARVAGCPMDQVQRFLDAGYIAQPKQLLFHAAARACDRSDGPDDVLFGGARGPGKSHAVLAQVGLDDCQRIAGLKVLFLRQIQKSAAESLEDLVGKTLRGVEHRYVPSAGRVEFPNGSRILLGGFKNDSDLGKYLGIEYDLAVVEELTQLTKGKYVNGVKMSVRSARDDWRARNYNSSNPGGIGHHWVKEMFVTAWREKREGETRYIPATFRDNMFLKPEYIRRLSRVEGVLGRAWRDGDWDVFEGMALPAWNQDRHVVTPFEIPEWWPRWRSVDWGYAAPFCCLWAARDPDRDRIFVYREVYGTLLNEAQQAKLIRDNTPPGETISITYADPAMWGSKTMGSRTSTTAAEYEKAGVVLSKADNDRLMGKRKLDRRLADLADGEPGVVFFSNCVNTVRTLASLPRDPHAPEDVDTKAEDHAYDAVRYLLTNEEVEAVEEEGEKQRSPWERLEKHL